MKNSGNPVTITTTQSGIFDWVDSPNVYAAARAERSRFIKAWFARLTGKQDAAKPNADGLAPLGMSA